MNEWTAYWTNDPDDDYNLVREIVYNDYLHVAVIKQTPDGLILTWYPQKEMLTVPLEWIIKVLQETQHDLMNLKEC